MTSARLGLGSFWEGGTPSKGKAAKERRSSGAKTLRNPPGFGWAGFRAEKLRKGLGEGTDWGALVVEDGKFTCSYDFGACGGTSLCLRGATQHSEVL